MLVDWVDMRLRVLLVALTLALTLAPLAAPLLAASASFRGVGHSWFLLPALPSGSGAEFLAGWGAGGGVRAVFGNLLGGRAGGVAQVASGSLVVVGRSGGQFGGCRYGSVALAWQCAGFSVCFGIDVGSGGGGGSVVAREFIATSFLTVGRRLRLKSTALGFPR